MPSALPQIIRRLQDQDDVASPSGASDDGKSYVWNNATSSFDLATHLTQASGDSRYLQLTGGTLTGHMYTNSTINVESSGNVNTNRVSARTSAGLTLSDDSNTLGIFVEDGGQVGVGNSSPNVQLHVGPGIDAATATNTLLSANNTGQCSLVALDSTNNVEMFMSAGPDRGIMGSMTAHQVDLRRNNQTIATMISTGVQINTGLYLESEEIRALGADGLTLSDDSGTLGLFIEDGGFVGVGNSDPSVPLHVGFSPSTVTYSSTQILASSFGDASVTVKNEFTDLEGVFTASANEFRFGTVTNHPFEIRTFNIARMTLHDTGVVMASGLRVETDEIRALGADGLTLSDDSGTLGLFIEDGGFVGVGTSSPISQLHIGAGGEPPSFTPTVYINPTGGATLLLRGSTNDVEALFNATDNVYIGAYSNHDLNIRTNNLTRIFVDNGGQVGINTIAPGAQLGVNGTVRMNSLRIDQTPTSETITPTHTVTVSLNGTDYKIPVVAA